MASFESNSKYGYIDRTGKIIIPAIYNNAISYFEHGYATMANEAENIFINKDGKICFSGLGIKEIIDSRFDLLTVRTTNDSLYLMTQSGVRLNQQAANEIALVDSKSFLFRVGASISVQTADTTINMPGTNFTKIFALNNDYYSIESKTDSNAILKTATNKYGKAIAEIATENGFFSCSRSIGIIAKYYRDDENQADILITYIDKTGKYFSDLKE